MGFFQQRRSQFERGAILVDAVELIPGLRSAENIRVIQILERSVYVLSLEAPIQLSAP
ncbi:hypothetical protein [Nostoc sp. WHI]|uniref:hypothetical protein n=1 Tax=Nostoc sp. WHI TaxID=2650611 RepID=UPI0018C6AD67|nr:hypothetical protein [Nostoc sp. WHI]